MIDPQTGHCPGRDQLEQKPVRFVEDLRQFHPDRRQVVNVEEAPVVDLLRRDPPEGEAISLVAEEGIERVETARSRPACR